MLSYQHAYHAGNFADVHKHSLLAWMLDYMCQKDKPISYLESHAGRGLYDLNSLESLKTGEAKHGIKRLQACFPQQHPYVQALTSVQVQHGEDAYPGSPLIAAHCLRAQDRLTFAELHPQEFDALKQTFRALKTSAQQAPRSIHCQHMSGWEMLRAQCPPTPRRGITLIDPSYEVKSEYNQIPKVIASTHKKWPVGIIALWYPILKSQAHMPMIAQLQDMYPDAKTSEIMFPPAHQNHGMIGTGLWVYQAPFGFEHEAQLCHERLLSAIN